MTSTMDELRLVTVETCVVLTSVLLVVRFLLDFFGPWRTPGSLAVFVVPFSEAVNYSMVHYTMGLMQLSSKRVNDYFQVWAALLVTLQYSVKIGRPYSVSKKQTPLLDLMSSLWTANLIRLQTFRLLQIILWLIWALNALRIINYFLSLDKAKGINETSTRLVGDYMRYEHTLGSSPQSSADVADPDKPFTMKWCKFLVLGEDRVLKDKQKGHIPDKQAHQQGRRKHGIVLDPEVHEKLITVDKIWDVDGGEGGLLGSTADPSNQLRDVCLSFALYKLLRRRFYNLPMHEARLPRQKKKIRRLVFDYILCDVERAFRVMATEVSFLQDMFYSKHAALFAAGFPAATLVFPLLLVAAVGYIMYAIRYIPERMDKADRNMITHGVFITRLMGALIICREVAEIYIYIFSQWTKVLILCNYTKRRCLQHPFVGMLIRAVLFFMRRGKWDEKIRQHNILISARFLPLYKSIKLETCIKQTILEAFKRLDKEPGRLDSYFSNAFGPPDQPLHGQLLWAVKELEADTHRILVWHIATCLCEIKLASEKEATTLRLSGLPQQPFLIKKSKGTNTVWRLPLSSTEQVETASWWEHYTTAVTISNYCAYLVAHSLVPDNGIVIDNVLREVIREIDHVILDGFSMRSFLRRIPIRAVFHSLMGTIDNPNCTRWGGCPLDIKNSLTRKGAKLADQLMKEYQEDMADLWEKLADFWTGFLLHLAASTRVSKHKMGLAGGRELTTHLWTLLSHAGFLGRTGHGQMTLDPHDLWASNYSFSF